MDSAEAATARTVGLPRYVQLSERLIREIAAGHLAHGTRLPPEREMATTLGTSVGTLRKALADLEEKGLLRRIQGSGNYVQHRAGVASVYSLFRIELLSGGGLPGARILSVARLAKPVAAPGFGPSAEGHRIRRLRRLDDTVVALEEIWLDGDRAARIAVPELSESLYLYYRDRLNLVIGRVEDRIGAAPVPGWTDAAFGPAAGTTAAFVERISRDTDDAPVEYSRTWFDSGVARYVARNGKV